MLSLGSNISATQVVESKYSASFDGTDDYIQIGDVGAVKSMSLWFNPDSDINSSSTASRLVGFSTGYFGVSLGAATSSFSDETLTVMPNDTSRTMSSRNFTAGEWYHLVISWNASNNYFDIYINNVAEVDNSTGTHSLANWTDFKIGDAASGNNFPGKITEVALWSTTLDSNNIGALYNGGKPINATINQGNYDNSSNLTGYWRMGNGSFDDKANGIVHDQDNPGFGSNLVTWDGSTTGDWSVAYANTTLSANSGRLRATANASGAYGVSQSFTTVVGEVYRVDYNINVDNASGGAGNLRVSNSSSLGSPIETLSSSTKVGTDYFTATATTTHVGLVDTADDSSNYLELESISVKKLNGNPGVTSGGVTFSSDNP